MTHASLRKIVPPEERRLVRKWSLWNVAIYGTALAVAVGLAAATRGPVERATAMAGDHPTSRAVAADTPRR